MSDEIISFFSGEDTKHIMICFKYMVHYDWCDLCCVLHVLLKKDCDVSVYGVTLNMLFSEYWARLFYGLHHCEHYSKIPQRGSGENSSFREVVSKEWSLRQLKLLIKQCRIELWDKEIISRVDRGHKLRRFYCASFVHCVSVCK